MEITSPTCRGLLLAASWASSVVVFRTTCAWLLQVASALSWVGGLRVGLPTPSMSVPGNQAFSALASKS